MTQPPSPPELSALKEAAENATPGPWRYSGSYDGGVEAVHASDSRYGETVYYICGMRCPQDGHDAKDNAYYVALANPATILSLLHALATLTAENLKLREALEPIRDWETMPWPEWDAKYPALRDRLDELRKMDPDTAFGDLAVEIARSALQPKTGEAK